jgi:hypothetical protein
MTELAVRDAYQPDRIIQRSGGVYERDIIDGWVQVLDDVSKLANFIAETDFVPRALRNRPAAVAACILTGRELGIGPMQSLKSIHMVQGVPSLSAEYKRARALAAGHDIVFDDTSGTRCVVRGRRAGSERWVTITWNLDMARRAKLAGKDVWQQYPQRMLQARASSELCDLIFPDSSLGLATTEILEDGGIVALESGEVDAASGEVTSGTQAPAIEAAKPKTAQRRNPNPSRTPAGPTAAAPATSSAQASQKPQPPAPASERTAPSGDALPPLPGEEEPDPTGSPRASSPAGQVRSPEGTSPSSTSSPDGSAGSPDDSDYDTHGTVTTPQITAIWTVLNKEFQFGSDEKDQARMVCAQIVRHDLDSTKNLSRNEAKAILDTLGHWRSQAAGKGEDTRAYLIEMLTLMETGEVAGGE